MRKGSLARRDHSRAGAYAIVSRLHYTTVNWADQIDRAYDVYYMLSFLRSLPRTCSVLSPVVVPSRAFSASPFLSVTLNQAMRRKKPQRVNPPKSPLLDICPQKKGVCTQIFIMKPKKPNSAKRKVARVKLSNGNSIMAYIPGEGHNLQEHSVVMVRGGRTQDLPGVRYVQHTYPSEREYRGRPSQVQSGPWCTRLWWCRRSYAIEEQIRR